MNIPIFCFLQFCAHDILKLALDHVVHIFQCLHYHLSERPTQGLEAVYFGMFMTVQVVSK